MVENKSKKKENENEKEKENGKENENKLDFKIGKYFKNGQMTYTILITGEKKKPDFPKKHQNKRKFGKFRLVIYKTLENFDLKNEHDPKILLNKNGVHQFIWKIKYYKNKLTTTTKSKDDENKKSEKIKKIKKDFGPLNSVINEEIDDENDENNKKENNENEEKK